MGNSPLFPLLSIDSFVNPLFCQPTLSFNPLFRSAVTTHSNMLTLAQIFQVIFVVTYSVVGITRSVLTCPRIVDKKETRQWVDLGLSIGMYLCMAAFMLAELKQTGFISLVIQCNCKTQ